MSEQSERRQRVLITGGSGYLGQFLVRALADAGHAVHWTWTSTPPAAAAPGTPHRVDMRTGEGLAECLGACLPLDAVFNTAAVSQPGVCAADPQASEALNVPTRLLAALANSSPGALFVHISTDQVYDGSKPLWREEEAGCGSQANAYGLSKAAAETSVRAAWPRHAILRSSIIYGPPPPYAPVARALFLQWLDSSLSSGPVQLFEDEWRSPIFVLDLVALCLRLLGAELAQGDRTLNAGGVRFPFQSHAPLLTRTQPQRLSRADMGDALAAARGYPAERVQRVPSASVVRTPASPADISMDGSRTAAALGLQPRPFAEALGLIFGQTPA